jgi:hypothetical protein
LAASQHVSQNYFITKQLDSSRAWGLATFIFAALTQFLWRKMAMPLGNNCAAGCAVVMVTPINARCIRHTVGLGLAVFHSRLPNLLNLRAFGWLASFLTKKYSAGKLSIPKRCYNLLLSYCF